ncbi:hypothetical protein [Sporolituus thermophilus]|uniref:Uncharacterized protein n=1 Tax=Sporolituus thermophilus DSM 23256 TaxID=1123285 RepID=A0A1G7NQG2_9FIRM|nr:hypothetical protein [Sporolituus thermophilus]SDF76315.1 hypothetical protein SAMN05660235_02670 [Sporolituus thermophilus DSM 23256]
MDRPSWWSFIPANMPLPLLLIIIYLFIIALGNLFALYQYVAVQPNLLTAIGHLVSVLLYAGPAYGLLKLKRWARSVELYLSLFSVALGLFLMFTGAFGMAVMIIVPHGLIAIYLLTDKCRELFGLTENK